ncbi:MAG: LysE family translocator [Acidobacteria bacterium]|nr:LysE family translocator [Acidobacteriota bacterium]MCA1609465.1 LysE family translocator [Acidobacteriota bacterium]
MSSRLSTAPCLFFPRSGCSSWRFSGSSHARAGRALHHNPLAEPGPRPAGFFSALGVAVGSVVHVAAATLGLSALLVFSALAFELVRFLAAGYLIWLGVRRILSKDGDESAASLPKRPLAAVFRQGAVVNLLNPKTTLFYTIAAGSLGGRLLDRPGILSRGRCVSDSVSIRLGPATAFGASGTLRVKS